MTSQKDLEQHFIKPNATIREAITAIEHSKGKICLVVSDENFLLGTITDGDIRRGFLKGLGLETPVDYVMKKDPFAVSQGMDRTALLALMQSKNIRNIPIIDTQRRVVDLFNLADFIIPQKRDNFVVIMAGGFGKRLLPLTENVPKPMLEVGGTPVLEILINSFTSQGFNKFFITVNYLAEQIKDYFQDGKSYDAHITYIEEDEPLGTAGALSLIKQDMSAPFFVVNGDIITNVKYQDMMDFHLSHKAHATIGVREHKTQIPYGVVRIEGERVIDIQEKPKQTHLVNTGIYVLNPDAKNLVPPKQEFTMPRLLTKIQAAGEKLCAYTIHEYWVDIGRLDDFSKAEKEFLKGLD